MKLIASFVKLGLLLFFILLGPYQVNAETVQELLGKMKKSYPQLVGYINETDRYFLIKPRREAFPAKYLNRLQDAFYNDTKDLCKKYGKDYLLDWQLLMSKAARETFWGTSFLCNRACNYFGIKMKSKPWLCKSFQFCESHIRDDPYPSRFTIFKDFESCLWMFIHTIYSPHFLERLPDAGNRVAKAIQFERSNGLHYYDSTDLLLFAYRSKLTGPIYSTEAVISTWSGYEKNNLCVNCNIQSDLNWIEKIKRARVRNEK